MKQFWNHNKEKIFLILIFLIGMLFRFYGLNWDQNAHIHPDERFLTMVGNSMKVPTNFTDYLNPNISTFNPANIGYSFFVYGIFPISLNKIVAVVLQNDNYNAFTIQGRFLSALADLLIIVLIFKAIHLLEKKYKIDPSVKYFSSFLYAIFVLPIQLSHFFAVDTFLNLFVFATFFFSLNYWVKKKIKFILIAGIFFGLAVASKITAIAILLLVIPFVFKKEKKTTKSLLSSVLHVLLFLLTSYFVLRLTDPYIFNSPNVLDIAPNKIFINNLNELRALGSRDSFYPPNIQWINKNSLSFAFKNFVVFGIGIPAFIIFLLGIYKSLKSKLKIIVLGILSWILFFFIYQGSQVAVAMRYFLLIYPFVAITGGFGLVYIYKKFGKPILILSLIIASIWGLMFFSIYTKPHSRVTASYWILENIPAGKTILSEAWDDALPLFEWGRYKIIQLPVFDPYSPEKWQMMDEFLAKGDYLILSSNRGWGSIPTVPERYPKMVGFYKDLLDNKLLYKKIKEFTSYPSLSYLRIPLSFPDQWADESFTVYDHPKVMIFKKTL